MIITSKHSIKNIVTAIAVTMFFSCKNNFKEVQKIGMSENEPIGVAENINFKHTDSGKVKAILISPKMLNYANREFPYREFPEGINLEIFEKGKKNTIISDYAIIYDKTGLIDLQDNVRVSTPEKDTLFAEQLYYDQKKELLFTNRPITFRTKQDIIKGVGFDTDKSFTNAEVLEVEGIITVSDNQ